MCEEEKTRYGHNAMLSPLGLVLETWSGRRERYARGGGDGCVVVVVVVCLPPTNSQSLRVYGPQAGRDKAWWARYSKVCGGASDTSKNSVDGSKTPSTVAVTAVSRDFSSRGVNREGVQDRGDRFSLGSWS